MHVEETATLKSWKEDVRGTLERIINGDSLSSRCGEYEIERCIGGVKLSRVAAKFIVSRLTLTESQLRECHKEIFKLREALMAHSPENQN